MMVIPHGIVMNYTATIKCATTGCGITRVCNWSSHRWLQGSELPLVDNYQNSSLHFKQLGTHHLNKTRQCLQFINMTLQMKTANENCSYEKLMLSMCNISSQQAIPEIPIDQWL